MDINAEAEAEPDTEMLDLDDMEIKVEKELSDRSLLEKRIKELEFLVSKLLEEKRSDEDCIASIKENFEAQKQKLMPRNIFSKCMMNICRN